MRKPEFEIKATFDDIPEFKMKVKSLKELEEAFRMARKKYG